MNKVGIFGTPRSGTSWLAHIFNSHPDVLLRFQPLFSYGHKGRLSERSSTEDIQTFFNDILDTQDPFALMTTESQKHFPIFQKNSLPTHIVFKETRYLHVVENMMKQFRNIRIIGIVRNPLAVLASWVSAPKEFHPDWNLFREWREAPSKNQGRQEEFFGYNKWKEVAEAFLWFEKQYSQQFILINYNELNVSPVEVTKKLFSSCQLTYCQQVEDFLYDSKSRHDSDPYSVYKSKADDSQWQYILPQEIINDIVLDLKNTPLEILI